MLFIHLIIIITTEWQSLPDMASQKNATYITICPLLSKCHKYCRALYFSKKHRRQIWLHTITVKQSQSGSKHIPKIVIEQHNLWKMLGMILDRQFHCTSYYLLYFVHKIGRMIDLNAQFPLRTFGFVYYDHQCQFHIKMIKIWYSRHHGLFSPSYWRLDFGQCQFSKNLFMLDMRLVMYCTRTRYR